MGFAEGIQAAVTLLATLVPTVAATAAQVHESQMNEHYTDKRITKEDLKPGDHIFVKLCSGSSKGGSPGSGSSESGSPGSSSTGIGSSGSGSSKSGSAESGSSGSGSSGSGSSDSGFAGSGSSGSGSSESGSTESGSSGSGSSESGSAGSGSSGSGSLGNIILGFTYHHGIYLGNDEVTDFGAVNQKYPVIRPLADFLRSREDCIFRREYVATVWTPEETVELARIKCEAAEKLAKFKHYDYEPYHFTANNCEQYATKLKTAKHWSGQVEKAQFWNSYSARERYQNCNPQGVPGSSSTPSSSSVRGLTQVAIEHAGTLVA